MFYDAIIAGENSLLVIAAFIVLIFFKTRWKIVAFLTLISIGLNGLYDSFHYSGLIVQYPRFFGLNIPLAWLGTPATYILMRYLTSPSFVFKKKHFFHFLPFVVRLATIFPVWMLSVDEKYNIIIQNYPRQYAGNLKGVMNFYPLAIYINVYYFAIGILLYKKNRMARKELANPGGKPLTYTYYFVWFVCMVFSLKVAAFGVYAGDNIIVKNALILFGFVYLLLFIMLSYFPVLVKAGFFLSDESEPERTYLKNRDLPKIEQDMALLIEKEKIYLKENLSLPDFSAQMHLKVHQMSEYLNKYHHQKYQDFINHYRVEHAKTLLKTDNFLPLKHVAYQSGFASYNPFYQAFKKETGLSPDEWIKKT
ncbi:MAG: AraC family transcriptional regulator [Spirochaetia bacterium]|nr:AraC family transcriptional regulator [Spirochaetia bacterium]